MHGTMESRSLVLCYLVVVGAVALVQSLPASLPARSTLPDSVNPRRVFWSNASQVVPVPVQSLAERLEMLEAVRSTIKEKQWQQCSPILHAEGTLPKDLSLCPWAYHSEDEDPDRFPVLIRQAYCECRNCHLSRLVNYRSTPGIPFLHETSACREVYENRIVLRRAIPGNETSPYIPYEVSVSVACVCQKVVS